MRRVCANFDDESVIILEEYLAKYGGSTANLLRRALQCLKDYEDAREKASWDNIVAYVDYLAKMEHVIVDIAHWKAIFSEIGEGSEKFWENVYEIGEEHLREFLDKGLEDVESILEYIENKNWYKLSIDSKNSFTLILAVSEASRFVRTFFEGLFKNYEKKVEVIEEFKKIRIRVM
jgi:hypothetical protein